ncbi:MAG TPA: BON domain-containing protein [Longimicrobium sp.]|nr:BON domain-containing protein [Longimicrobium sp.]
MRRLAAVALPALAGACGVFQREAKETPAQVAARQTEDARILREVEARLAAEPSIGAGRIRVEVQSGEVGLFGAVSGLGALRCAERNAELVRGVRLVIDHLVLDPGPRDVRCLAPRVFAAPVATGS